MRHVSAVIKKTRGGELGFLIIWRILNIVKRFSNDKTTMKKMIICKQRNTQTDIFMDKNIPLHFEYKHLPQPQ